MKYVFEFLLFVLKLLLVTAVTVSGALVTIFTFVWTARFTGNPWELLLFSVLILFGVMFFAPHLFMSKKRWFTLTGGLLGMIYILSVFAYQMVLDDSVFMISPLLDSIMLIAASVFYLMNWIKFLKYGPSFLLPAPGAEA